MRFEGSPKGPDKKKKPDTEKIGSVSLGNAVRAAAVVGVLGAAAEALPTSDGSIDTTSIPSVIESTKKMPVPPGMKEIKILNPIGALDGTFSMQDRWHQLPQSQNIEDRRGEKVSPELQKRAATISAREKQGSRLVSSNGPSELWSGIRNFFSNKKKEQR